MKKWLIKGVEWISYLLVLFGLVLEIFTSVFMGEIGLLIFYGIPICLLLGIMLYEIKTEKNKQEKEKIKKKRLGSIFLIYVISLITLLFMPSVFRHTATWQQQVPLFSKENLQNSVNLIPFQTIASYLERGTDQSINLSIVVTNLLGNLVAFAPFGFFVPLLMKDKIKNIGMFLLFVIGMVFIVEILQFFLRVGSADIDDLILNTLGATIFYGIMQIPFTKKVIDKIVS